VPLPSQVQFVPLQSGYTVYPPPQGSVQEGSGYPAGATGYAGSGGVQSEGVEGGEVPLMEEEKVLGAEILKERFLERQWDIYMKDWIKESWLLFKAHWNIYLIWSLGYLAIAVLGAFIPFASLAVIPHMGGLYYATFNLLRATSLGHLENKDFLQGYLWILPLVVVACGVSLATCAGMVLLIIPGIYIGVTLSFSFHLYMEYSMCGIGIMECMTTSYYVCSRRFWAIFKFFFLNAMLAISGALALGVGFLVSLPVACICSCIAFREIIGLRDVHEYAIKNNT